MEVRLNLDSSLLLLVGLHRVSVLVLPPVTGRHAFESEASENLVGSMLTRLGLGEYCEQFKEARYDLVPQLFRMTPAEREQLTRDIGMKPGHALTLAMHLDGRLPVDRTAGSVHKDEPAAQCWAIPIPIPSKPPVSAGASPAGLGAPQRPVASLTNHSSSGAFCEHKRRVCSLLSLDACASFTTLAVQARGKRGSCIARTRRSLRRAGELPPLY